MRDKIIKFQVKRVVNQFEDYQIELSDGEYKSLEHSILMGEIKDENDLVEYLMESDFDVWFKSKVSSETDDYVWNSSHGEKLDNTTEFIENVIIDEKVRKHTKEFRNW
jgi:hypothetical protein